MAAEREGKLTKQIVFRVDDEMYAALERDAERHGRTVTQSVRFYLRDLKDRLDADTPYVWVNRMCTRFHLYESCAAGEPTRMTLDAALRRGVRPCKVCKADRLLTPTGGPDGEEH